MAILIISKKYLYTFSNIDFVGVLKKIFFLLQLIYPQEFVALRKLLILIFLYLRKTKSSLLNNKKSFEFLASNVIKENLISQS